MIQMFQTRTVPIRSSSVLPPAPTCSFASDNAAGVHPAVLEAMTRANHDHTLAYSANT